MLDSKIGHVLMVFSLLRDVCFMVYEDGVSFIVTHCQFYCRQKRRRRGDIDLKKCIMLSNFVFHFYWFHILTPNRNGFKTLNKVTVALRRRNQKPPRFLLFLCLFSIRPQFQFLNCLASLDNPVFINVNPPSKLDLGIVQLNNGFLQLAT